MTEARRFIDPDTPLAPSAEAYLEAMLACQRDRARDLVFEQATNGSSMAELYLQVFQPVQYEMGWLWQTGRVTVGQEHYCTNATQLIMAQLYPRMFTGKRGGPRLLATCVQSELHELGLRMVADFFEMAGWDTQFLGANMPEEGVVSTLTEWRADVLAIGVTMHDHLEEAQQLISAVRRSARGRDVVILVGGYSLRVVEGLWQQLGADGTAHDAHQALALATRLVDERRLRGSS